MTRIIRKCTRCQRYTMHPSRCPQCGESVIGAHPPRFSIEDRYGKYRRAMKKALQASQPQPETKASDV